MELWCGDCKQLQSVPRPDVACRFCGQWTLRRPPTDVLGQSWHEYTAALRRKASVHSAGEGLKIEAFLMGTGMSARRLSQLLSIKPRGKLRTPVSERTVRRWLRGGHTFNRHAAMRLAQIMVEYGYPPAVIHPHVRTWKWRSYKRRGNKQSH